LEEIGKRSGVLRVARDRRNGVADSAQLADIEKEVDKAVQEVQAFASAVKKKLNEIRGENEAFESKYPDARNSSSLEMRARCYTLAVINCKKTLDEFSSAHNAYLVDIRDGQKRRIQQVASASSTTLDEKTIDDLVESGRADEVLQRSLISEDLRSEVEALEQRRTNIQALERELRALYELFKDVATLVDIQQGTIDTIEGHIQKAKGYTIEGAKALENAEKHQKCSRMVKKNQPDHVVKSNKRVADVLQGMCCICVIVTIVLLFILIPSLVLGLKNA